MNSKIRWSVDEAREWYRAQPWLVGCNFLPSTAINQLEMWQGGTYDPATIDRELGWAESLGFNALRVYLHDLVWAADPEGFSERIDDFLGIAKRHGMSVLLALFDDCHRPDPEPGVQPLPVPGVHNSGWKQSPGRKLVLQFHDGTVPEKEEARLAEYVRGVLTRFADDERILMWDLYNEPGQGGKGDKSNPLLQLAWQWAHDVRPSQPLTACLDGSVGERNIALNRAQSDVITFHCYVGESLEKTIVQHRDDLSGRPLICTEYMARELGTTFQHSLPIFKRHQVGCFNWGLVAGKSQTHFNWLTIGELEGLKAQGAVLNPGDPIPEPPLWFHDIFRIDGTPFDQEEIDFIRDITGPGHDNRTQAARVSTEEGRMNPQSRSAEEERLDFFVGDWNNPGTVLPGPFGPGGSTTGKTSYRWDVGNKWLLYVSRLELPGMGKYEVHGGVAFNNRVGKYDAYAVNSLGNLLVYEGEWTDGATLVFTLVHPRSGGARVTYRKSPDGSIKMTAENASGDGEFVPYFEISFIRAG